MAELIRPEALHDTSVKGLTQAGKCLALNGVGRHVLVLNHYRLTSPAVSIRMSGCRWLPRNAPLFSPRTFH